MEEQGIVPFYMAYELPIYSDEDIEIWYDSQELQQAQMEDYDDLEMEQMFGDCE